MLLETYGSLFVIFYLLSLVMIVYFANKSQKGHTMSDFYLANRDMNFGVLFLTLYATQYSGNTVIGYSGKIYRSGFIVLLSVTFMIGVIGGLCLIAPKLFQLGKKYNFLTIGDFVQKRFQYKKLTICITIISIIALLNYIFTNLKASGYIIQLVSGGLISFNWGIIIISVIMLTYELLGGMRSIAWTDVIQGCILLLGIVLVFLVFLNYSGGIINLGQQLQEIKPMLWDPPTFKEKMQWMSLLITVAIGIPLYPHMIQRIFASQSEKTLKKSFQLMVFMPFLTTLLILLISLSALIDFPHLTRQESDTAILLVLNNLVQNFLSIKIIFIVFILSAIAAIMSTIDSALLSISSLFSNDIYNRLSDYQVSQKTLLKVGKIASIVVMSLAVLLSIQLPETIWFLFQLKLELLCQIAPAIFLGLHFKSIHKKSVLIGCLIGIAICFLRIFPQMLSINIKFNFLGLSVGLWGLIVNTMIVLIGSMYHYRDINKNPLRS